jgi:restriction system protein
MPVPDFQSLMLPVLKATSNGLISAPDLRDRVAKALTLSPSDLEELLPSGRQAVFANRVAWANIFLQRAGLIDRVRRGQYRISAEGRAALAEGPSRIDMSFLNRYPSYRKWREVSLARDDGDDQHHPPNDELEGITQTPEEAIEALHRTLTQQLQADLLERLREAAPAAFERIIVELLLAMGYGGGRKEMGEAIGRAGDGGIDGVIKEDELGLDVVYMQAKRNGASNTVGEPDIRDFVGALVGRRANKGVFVTTSSFSKGARDYADRVPNRIILIDGARLTSLMVMHGVGVRTRATYDIKGIDEEFFTE